MTEYRYLVLGAPSGVPSFCPIAQLAEHATVNRGVPGSIPGGAACVIVLSRRDETGDSVLDVLKKHIQTASDKCSVSDWVSTLAVEEQKAFDDIKTQSENINVSSLYKDLNTTDTLPFKLTAFRSHLRGYCTCPKN